MLVGSWTVVPNNVAVVAPEPQVIANVTRAPGAAVDGVTSTTGPCAKAGCVKAGTAAAARVAAPASISVVAAERMKRIRKFPRSYAGPPRATSRVCVAAAPSGHAHQAPPLVSSRSLCETCDFLGKTWGMLVTSEVCGATEWR